jgi:hypothetical protein
MKTLLFAAIIGAITCAIVSSPRWLAPSDKALKSIALEGFASDGFARRPQR